MASPSQAPGQDSEPRPPSIADGKPRWIPVMPYANFLGLRDASVGSKIGSHTQLMLDQIRRQRVLDVTSETLQDVASLTNYSSGDNHQLNQISGVRDFANESLPNETVPGKNINVAQAADGDPVELPSTQKKDEKNRPVPVESASVHQPESASLCHPEIEEHSMKEYEGVSNKMQQPKPKRKKLRPKVLREDRPPRAPKSDPTPPVTPKPPKRKYVRKKNVPKPSDVPTNPLGESVDLENENGIKVVKRRLDFNSEEPRAREGQGRTSQIYVRKKNVPKPSDVPTSPLVESVDLENENGIKAVKRRLDFNSEEPCAREGQGRTAQIYACNEALNIILPQSKRKHVQETCACGTLSSSIVISAATSSQEQEVNDEKSPAGTRCTLNTSVDQVPSEYIQPPETPTPTFQPSRKRRSVRIIQKHGGNDRVERTSLFPPHPSKRERIQENLKELYLNVTGNSDRSPESCHKNQLPPNSSTALLLQGLKRAYNFVGDNCIQGYKGSACTNERMGYMIRTEVCSNGPYFPKIHKKKRTQKGLKVTPNAALLVPSASSNNLNIDRDIAAFERERASWLHRALFNQRLPKEDMAPDLPAQTSRLIPPGITEAWNNLSNRLKPPGLSSTQCYQLSTPEKRPGCNISYGSMSYGRQYSYVNWTTKKRTKKEDKHLVRSGPLYRNQISLAGYDSTSSGFSSHGKYHVHITAQASRRSPVSRISCRAEKPFQGIPSASMMVRYEDLLDSIVWKMKSLNLYGIHVTDTAETQHALVPYNGGGRILVPYARSLVIAKKQPLRPKVDLDEETTRVWNLLMEKGSTDEGVDVEKDKWWEQERRTVRGRIDSFIARMHLVQGDRRFSRWKGSVVDSVVGVFLTQNVSDHLSSSAFMALAAKYPCRSEENNNSSDAEMSSTSAAQQEVCSVDSDDHLKCQKKMFSKELLYQDFFMTPEAEHAADREIGNYESLGSNSCTTLLDYSIGNHLEIHASEQEVGHQSPGSSKNTLVAVTGSISAAETEDKSTEDVVSSKSSIISSQNSSELIVQSDGQTEPISITDMEDLVSGGLHNVFNSSTSFMELLQMAESASFKEMYSSGNLLSEEFYITPGQMAYSEFNKRTSIEAQQDKYKGECPSLHRLNSNCHDMHDELMGVSHAASTSYESRSSRMASADSRMNAIQNDVIKVSDPSGSSSEDISQQMLSFTSSTSPETYVQVSKHSVQPLTCSEKGVYMDNQSCCHSISNKETSEASSCKNTPPESSILEGDQRAKLQHEEIGRKHAVNAIRAEGHDCDVRQASSRVHQSCLNLKNVSRETVEVVDEIESIKKDEDYTSSNDLASTKRQATRPKKVNSGKLKEDVDWDNLRKKSCPNGTKVERSSDTMDSVDWDAVRCADVKEVSETIRDRGMNNVLAQRIKNFLNRLVQDHGSIDLEWLRDIPPESTKDFLLSITGLGLKSAECVRLLTLHQLAFPVDTNVGRICVRLGWVPLQPLPESLQLHLLELYPVLESIQKYLWPRLCKLDQQTLYELHYQMITFGKVFCTKRQPNCNACPMRAECRHFASAFTSAKKLLTGPEEKGLVRSAFPNTFETAQTPVSKQKVVPQLEGSSVSQQATVCEPIIEEPASPEPEPVEDSIREIEEDFVEDPDEIPHIKLNLEAFTQNIQDFMQSNMKGQEGEMSNALVVLTQEAASIPVPKLKNRKRLRTEHLVYELQDDHPLLEGFSQREPDDPSPYLLAIWSPGETAHSYDQTERRCNSRGPSELCDIITCFACNSVREARTQTVRGTIMIPCRTANKGSFPLNGTYFQVNEVFADHESSLHPIVVPRHWIGSLPRRTVYFGTSVPAIFKGLTTDEIMFGFWKGFVCVRGFDRETGAPRPLYARLHLAASKAKNMKAAEEAAAAAVAAAVAEEARKQKQEEATMQKQQQWRRSRNQM